MHTPQQCCNIKSSFIELMGKCNSEKLNIDNIILNYLILNGYYEAAIEYCQEAHITPLEYINKVKDFIKIKNCILDHKYEEAIHEIKTLRTSEVSSIKLSNTEDSSMNILDEVIFHIRKHQLIDIFIQNNDYVEALEFISTNMIPHTNVKVSYFFPN
ncbi:hypothetical protein ACR3K2_35040 [Cryptosporidium serpentis]